MHNNVLWQIYVTDNNTAHSYCNVQCLTFLYEYNQIWIFLTDFLGRLQYHILQTFIQWEPSCNVQTEGQTWQSWKVHITTMWTCLQVYEWVIISKTCFIYTGCYRRNGPNFGRVFLMLNYTDITQNTYVPSWTVIEIMAK